MGRADRGRIVRSSPSMRARDELIWAMPLRSMSPMAAAAATRAMPCRTNRRIFGVAAFLGRLLFFLQDPGFCTIFTGRGLRYAFGSVTPALHQRYVKVTPALR